MGGVQTESRALPPFLSSVYPLGKEDLGNSTVDLETPLCPKGEATPCACLSPKDKLGSTSRPGGPSCPQATTPAPSCPPPPSPPPPPRFWPGGCRKYPACGISQNSVLPLTCVTFSEPHFHVDVASPLGEIRAGWGAGLTSRTPPPSREDRAATVRQAEP